ncbi:binding-protein-dependent transport systems inner membrane component [Haladaptatus paucihalophilus DX253]|uniref:Binding-protein-dependent transport systems inner membrane component n=1 Tax=Haladaptatus paucihalophilus DX253 TaxID=797209 RepID=E7QRT0_HALPU|nr:MULTISPECIES: sugar ABC transporter permease [Haladaptatus]EFW92699.1 binding-protein-dependent transport systems inner membrane component [Haladaptatus paucihalophilus DX253]GKZ13703.1 ABC transporter permease [Haladaptatus sp. T7]SHK15322.1 carbohydrate ABC transporter membrane protein 1, CUT1 family [Haladaptatus paucihalophilus DX253]
MQRIYRKLKRLVSGEDESLRADGGTTVEHAESESLLSSEFVQSLPFWLPPFLLMGFFVYGAIGWNFIISLTDFETFQLPTYKLSALDFEMYRQLFNDPGFWTAARNTLVLLVAFTGLCLVFGLILAIIVDRDIRFENTFRTIYLLPMSLSFVVTAKFWAWMYNFNSGMINVTFRSFGLDFLAHQWISDPTTKLAAVIFALIWQFSGYAMVVYLAGLRAIPDEHFEAARVDGASTWRMYRRVIVPQLRASTVSAAVVLMVFALKAFDFLYVMFGRQPGPAADILATMMYREAFGSLHWAYGSAIAIVLFVMALAVVTPYLYNEYRRGEL